MSWNISKLGEECKIFSGNSINAKTKESLYTNVEGTPYIATKDITYDGNINYLNGISIPEEDHDKFRKAKSECVFICAEGGSAGRKIAFSDTECFFVNKLFCLEAGSNLLPKYIYYYLRSEAFQIQFKNALTGLIGGVSLSKIKLFEITYPSLPVQKQIVEKLDATFADIDKAISATEKNIENAESLFYKGLASSISSLRKEFKEIKFEDVTKEIFAGGDAPQKNKLSKEKTDQFSIPIFSNGVKDSGLYGYTNYARTEESAITISARGTIGHIEVRNEPFLPIVRLITVIPDPEKVDIIFLKYSLLSLDIFSTGSSIPQLTVPMIKTYSLPFPSLEAQKRLAKKLDLVRARTSTLKEVYSEKLIELYNLKSSILNHAFSGELTKDAA